MKKKINTKLEGCWGESVAAEYLRKKKYKIISMGYSSRMGEIDIIAANKKYLVFVEVKTRKDTSHGLPREFVTEPKKKRIRTTAEIWLQYNETALQPRFDVIDIVAPDGIRTERPIITHLEDAF